MHRADDRPVLSRTDRAWARSFVLRRTAVDESERRLLERRVSSGELRRVRAGVMTGEPRPQHEDDRHLELVRAVSLVLPADTVVSHRSAAAV